VSASHNAKKIDHFNHVDAHNQLLLQGLKKRKEKLLRKEKNWLARRELKDELLMQQLREDKAMQAKMKESQFLNEAELKMLNAPKADMNNTGWCLTNQQAVKTGGNLPHPCDIAA
jgi:hypothetical protein